MEIVLPIIFNVVTALVLIAGLFIGKNNGWRLTLSKLIMIAGAGLASYFWMPIVSNKLLEVEVVTNTLSRFGMATMSLHSISFALVFFAFYLFISLGFALLASSMNKQDIGINVAKRKRIKSFDRKADRLLRKEEKRLSKINREFKKRSKASKIFGSIFGIIIAAIIAFVMLMPIETTLDHIATNNPDMDKIASTYEYTVYGQLDNLVDISNIITGE